ncbi:YfgM family protein [Limnohabitans sp.]|jgi:predicted negative regulator of RcsB-dependent stress response|uniref:YfgM family protein n=1 Tax=Limnohabitans sp. TaxID=1907725 RepID=UPI0039192E32
MASNLDLEEQEQMAQLRHFWSTYGNWITWTLVLALASYAAWNGYQYWQGSQASKAAALYDEVERAVTSGDVSRIERSLADMQAKYASTTFAQQATLLAAKSHAEQDRREAARTALQWVADKASDPIYKDVARLRLAALLLDDKAHDKAMSILQSSFEPAMIGLASDLKGDVHMAQGRQEQAVAAYRQAWQLLDAKTEYRRIVQAKLFALGVDPEKAEATK